jgi:hypothetical protein
MDDSTTKSRPRYPAMVRALAGDSTMTSLLTEGLFFLLAGVCATSR